MGDLLRQGGQWLEQQRTAHCSSQVTYRREATELLVNATFGRTEYEIEDEYGLRVGAQVIDFLILADDLSPTFDEPEAGDQIVADGREQYDGLIAGIRPSVTPGPGHERPHPRPGENLGIVGEITG